MRKSAFLLILALFLASCATEPAVAYFTSFWKFSSVYRYFEGDWLSIHENWSGVETEE